ncbi:MAG: (Fe-S)-binding protein [Candidatus Thiodiazotropha sp. DIVDIV]
MQHPDTIYFYGTCLIDMLYPNAGLSAMKLISNAGVEIIFPQQQTCCGQPAFNSGYRAEALDVARQQLGSFKRPIPIVVPSGSCAGMIKHHWPELFSGEPDEAEALAASDRVYELTEFLVDVLKLELTDKGSQMNIAVHTSCSARREMGVAKHIKQLIGQLNQVEVVEHDRKKECCGFGGSFAIKQGDISGAIVNDKCQAIEETGVATLVSQDCGCLMNIGCALEKRQSEIRTLHIAEFIWERTCDTDD